jgi:hypothetical protein
VTRGLGVLARAVLLLTTTFFLAATAGPEFCGKDAEATFKIEGSCGPTGLIIVRADGRGTVSVENAPTAGIPGYGVYEAMACPPTLAKGGWTLTTGETDNCPPAVSAGDAAAMSTDAAISTDGAAGAAPGAKTSGPNCPLQNESCSTTLVNGQLWITCVTSPAGPSCSAQLTVAQ